MTNTCMEVKWLPFRVAIFLNLKPAQARKLAQMYMLAQRAVTFKASISYNLQFTSFYL